jgi:plastocyanin
MKLRTMGLTVAILVGCMTMAGTSQAATRAHARPVTTFQVSITEFMFTPGRILVHVGDTVTWTNNGGVAHTSSAKGGVWDSGVLSPGQMFSFTFASPGVFRYRCNIHHTMTGAIKANP